MLIRHSDFQYTCIVYTEIKHKYYLMYGIY